MSERRQLNIRLDNEPELHEAIKDQAHRMNVSVSAFIIMALKSSLDWQVPFDSAALLKRIQKLETEVIYLKKQDSQIQQTQEIHTSEFNVIRACIKSVNKYIDYLFLTLNGSLGLFKIGNRQVRSLRNIDQLEAEFKERQAAVINNPIISSHSPTIEDLDLEEFKSNILTASCLGGWLPEPETSEVKLEFIEALITKLNSSTKEDYKLVATKGKNE